MIRRSCLVGAVLLAACGPAAMPDGPAPRDVRVPIPAEDPDYLVFSTPERVIQPAEEKMWCTPMIYDGEDIAFTLVEGKQGKFGHHVLLVASNSDEPVGETYDCTQMKDFAPLGIPVDEYPTGFGTYLQAGKKVVIQMHYINTSEQPILVRDVIRLKKLPVADVKTWTSVFAANQAGFSLPPHSTGVKVSFDCTVPSDLSLLLVGGHMHEQGASFMTEEGPDVDHLTKLYGVDTWTADYRDAPPVTLLMTSPKALPTGSVVRTHCEWNNSTDRVLSYPDEMCATFMLVAGTKEPIICWDRTSK